MRIGVDARFLTHPQKGGFKTYTENLISALACIDESNQYVLYLDREPDQNTLLPKQSNFSFKVINQVPVIGMPWREQVGLKRQALKDRIDLFHSPCLTGPLTLSCPIVVTIHDTIWLFPQKYSQYETFSLQWKLMEWYNLLIPKYISKRAAAIITVSHSSKESIKEHLDVKPELIYVTHEAVNSSFRPIQDNACTQLLRDKYLLQSKYILAIGSADPRKNIKNLVNAYAALPQELKEQYRLVIVWTASSLAPALSRHVTALGIDPYVQFINQVSNDDLALLYNEASLFVFPSLYEGFGLPALEAMACGTPVAAANNSSIPEIVGDAALLFNAEDISTISSAMIKMLGDEIMRQDMGQKGLKRAGSFSWEQCARQTVAVYEKTLASR